MRYIGVSSCKGGVGKSSIAVNLAYALQNLGRKVGLLDCDIYGPSLPLLTTARSQQPSAVNESFPGFIRGTKTGGLFPVHCQHTGMPLMSMGYLKPDDFQALRGPMASAMLDQMLKKTEWPELDFLILDLPPGTGDIHLTISKEVPNDKFQGIVVTTPHALSLADVRKGLQYYRSQNKQVDALIVNQSHFSCQGCGTHQELYDESQLENHGIPHEFRLPFDRSMQSLHLPLMLSAHQQGISNETVRVFQELSQIF